MKIYPVNKFCVKINFINYKKLYSSFRAQKRLGFKYLKN